VKTFLKLLTLEKKGRENNRQAISMNILEEIRRMSGMLTQQREESCNLSICRRGKEPPKKLKWEAAG